MSAAPVRMWLPATSANLGPGFDALGLALSFGLEVQAELAGQDTIIAEGRDGSRIRNAGNSLILSTCRDLLRREGRPEVRLHLHLKNGIPLGMGCGSSAAALVAGVALASHFGGLGWPRERILAEASVLEGHPDNVAACVLGSLTASRMAERPGGAETARVHAVSVPVPVRWPLLLALPPVSLSTRQARALLPVQYSRPDAVLNVQNTALLVAAFALGRGDLLAEAMNDRLHQPYREPLFPLLPAVRSLAGSGGILGVALSGAGPAVLIVLDSTADERAVSGLVERQAAGARIRVELLRAGIGHGADLGTRI